MVFPGKNIPPPCFTPPSHEAQSHPQHRPQFPCFRRNIFPSRFRPNCRPRPSTIFPLSYLPPGSPRVLVFTLKKSAPDHPKGTSWRLGAQITSSFVSPLSAPYERKGAAATTPSYGTQAACLLPKWERTRHGSAANKLPRFVDWSVRSVPTPEQGAYNNEEALPLPYPGKARNVPTPYSER